MMTLVNLLYHDVLGPDGVESGFPGASADSYKLTVDDFRSHLDAIGMAAPGQTPAVLRSRSDAEGVTSGWSLTFDDAGISALDPTASMLEERGWRGHFFAATAYVGRKGFVGAAGLRELVSRGHVVGSHSVTHPLRMAALSQRRLLEEWQESRDGLSQLLGEDVRVASVPGGLYSPAVATAAAEAGMDLLFTSEPRTDMWMVESTCVLGRMSVKRETSAEEVAHLIRRMPGLLLRRRVSWGMRRVVRTVGGDFYLHAREALFRRSSVK